MSRVFPFVVSLSVKNCQYPRAPLQSARKKIAKTNRPFQNKIAMQLDRPLEAESKVKVDIPKLNQKVKIKVSRTMRVLWMV